jgi:hypothetical protein
LPQWSTRRGLPNTGVDLHLGVEPVKSRKLG